MSIDFVSLISGVGLGLLAIALVLVWNSYFHVEEGHRAVITRFGKALHKRSTPQIQKQNENLSFIETDTLQIFKPGGHWKLPWDKVKTFSIMERVIDLSGESSGKYAMAMDGTVLRLDSKIRFFPKPTEYYSYIFELKNTMDHIRELFTCLLRNEIANFQADTITSDETASLGSYSIIRRERRRLNEQVEYICKSHIGKFYGIQFSGVDLIDIVPPHELEEALNGIQSAQIEAETIYARAEADARQRIVAAEKGLEIERIHAESIVLELTTISKMIKKLVHDGNINNYLNHRKTELIGDSKMLFMQKGDLKW